MSSNNMKYKIRVYDDIQPIDTLLKQESKLILLYAYYE